MSTWEGSTPASNSTYSYSDRTMSPESNFRLTLRPSGNLYNKEFSQRDSARVQQCVRPTAPERQRDSVRSGGLISKLRLKHGLALCFGMLFLRSTLSFCQRILPLNNHSCIFGTPVTLALFISQTISHQRLLVRVVSLISNFLSGADGARGAARTQRGRSTRIAERSGDCTSYIFISSITDAGPNAAAVALGRHRRVRALR